MKKRQMTVSFASGLIFALGLGLAGMTQPQKIIGFLNVFAWDPSLIAVMAGAVGLHATLYPWIRRRHSPLFDVKWHVPDRRDLNPRLIGGAAIFGVGWGLGGYCPGPALTSLPSLDMRVVVFVAAMVAGMLLFRWTEKRFL